MYAQLARRGFFWTIGLGAIAVLSSKLGGGTTRTQDAGPGGTGSGKFPAIKAIGFDTFGTVVDWRSSLAEESAAWGKAKSIRNVDWFRFADRWRDHYRPNMDKVRKGEFPWKTVDEMNRMALDDVLKEFGITGISEEEKDRWNQAWHRLKPWPDSVRGLARLKKKYLISPCSNGDVGLLTRLSKHSGLPWDWIFGADLAKHYKPDPDVYLTAATLIKVKPEEFMMAAAHTYDLDAARKLGLRTGFIYRPKEYGNVDKADKAKPGDYDVVCNSITELAAQLGI
jgi:2-haloacid dehalogenase